MNRAGLILTILLVAGPRVAHGEAPLWQDFQSGPDDDASLYPRYRIEAIEVRGNRATQTELILRELFLRPGDSITADDRRVEISRLRLLSLGFFLDVRLSLQKGETRGQARLMVEVDERGTLVLDEVFLGSSEATTLWGGLTLTERNLLGRGIALGGGMVGSTRPKVSGSTPGFGATLRLAGPPTFFPGRLQLQGSAILTEGSEFFRIAGPDSSARPSDFSAVTTRRTGGTLGVGRGITPTWFLLGEMRWERISATLPAQAVRTLPSGGTLPLDFFIRDGVSRDGSFSLTLDWDTRSDPVLPRDGMHASASVEIAVPALYSSYTYVKGMITLSRYHALRRGHVLSFHGFAGGIWGDAPYFDRFFVGDVDAFLPPRALGLNFSTQPTHDFLGTGSQAHRYATLAGRGMVEYAIPLWKRHGLIYRGDAFLALGLFGLADPWDTRHRDRTLFQTLAADVTADLGIRLDTFMGVFTLSVANAIGRIPF